MADNPEIMELVVHQVKMAYEGGVHSERHRTLAILEKLKKEFSGNDYAMRAIAVTMKRIQDDK